MKNNKILVIGSSGQLASCLKEQTNENWHYIGRPKFDLCNNQQIISLINDLKPNLIINTAAYTNVDKAEQEIEAAHELNAIAVKHLSTQCSEHNIPLIHISTDYVFDGTKQLPYLEKDIPNPLSIYGKSKLAGEEHIRQVLKNHIILRTSWVFSHYGTNFVKTMIKLAGNARLLKIIDDQIGCPTSGVNLSKVIKQISNKILESGNNSLYGTYNYCDRPQLTWYEFARNIFEILVEEYDYKFPEFFKISSAEYNSVVKRPQNSVLDCSLIIRNFGIKQYDWRLELKNSIKKLL